MNPVVQAVVTAYQKQARAQVGILDRRMRERINDALVEEGLGGKKLFEKASRGYAAAIDVLGEHGIELDTVVNAQSLAGSTGTLRIDVAFTNEEDSFSPVSIKNSVLFLQFTELREDAFEVIAYMS